MEIRSRLHTRLAAGEVAFGSLCYLASPLAAELVAGSAEFDLCGVDMQHGTITIEMAEHMLRAIQAADPGVTPAVRVPSQDHYWLEQVLDSGFTTVIVPQVETAAEAAKLARTARFPPQGSRSYGGTTRAALYDDYFSLANDHLVLLPQIESRAGLENCEAIAAVDGITGLLLGPADLSLSHGWPLTSLLDNPELHAAMDRIVKACAAAGKLPTAIVPGRKGAELAAAHGFRVISFIADAIELRMQSMPRIRDDLQRLRS